MAEDTQEVSQAGGEVDVEIKDPKAVLEALERAKKDAKTYRESLEEKERAVEELNARIVALEGDERIDTFKSKILELHARQKLAQAGVKDVDRIYGLLGPEGLSLDDNGELQGFDEAYTALKTRLPELFDEKRRVANGADAFANEPVKQKMSGTEAQVARIFQH